MPVQADAKYEATVESAIFTTSAEKGTLGLFLNFKTGDGMVDRTWYVTENTVERLKENLDECFGVTEEHFSSDDFYTGGVNEFLHGKPCSITTEYKKDSNGNVYKDQNGRQYVTVQWLNPSRAGKQVTKDSLPKLKSVFGGNVVSRPAGHEDPPPAAWGADGITDEGAPF